VFASTVSPPPLPLGEVRSVPGRGEIFVRRCGPGNAASAPPVLLLHGWQATADTNFFPLYGPLGERRVVVAPDLRGHGRSLYPEEPFTLEDAADDAAALLHDLGIAHAVVLGYSLGTAVAQVMVHRHRSLVDGLVLMGGELAPNRRPHEKVYDRWGGWLATAQRLTSGRRAAHRIVDKAKVENPDIERLRGWLVREFERGHVASLRAAGRALSRLDGRAIAARHPEMPASVVVTERDRLVRPARQRALAEAWNAGIVSLDADHDAPITQPAAFVDAARRALQTVDERGRVHA
jgi:pimeloyl-ACP methyl ester carboxylesterase